MAVIWITGLPGSGKTTLARRAFDFFKQEWRPILLDGDELRVALGGKFGYSKEERVEIAKIYVNLAALLSAQGHLVIVSTVSLYAEIFTYLEERIPNVLTVFIDADLNLLNSRNQKNLRTTNLSNSPGVTLNVDLPKTFKFRLTGHETESEQLQILRSLGISPSE